jgi:hypothetical protein
VTGVPRATVFVALEAIEAGDHALAVQVLLDALEHEDPTRVSGLPRCRVCGVRAWPGDLRAHILSLHDAHELEAAA